MTGVDINLDTNIGKRLSTLSNTLTMLTGEEEEEGVQEEQLDDDLEDTENELPTIKVKPFICCAAAKYIHSVHIFKWCVFHEKIMKRLFEKINGVN